MNQQLQQFVERAKHLQQQLEMLHHQLGELENVKEGIVGIKDVGSEETLIPLGAGVFVKGTISDNKTLLMNVGAGVVVEKEVGSAQAKVEEQVAELQKIGSQMREEFNQLQQMIQMMQMQSMPGKE
jgi:prefoldin alpha subunit